MRCSFPQLGQTTKNFRQSPSRYELSILDLPRIVGVDISMRTRSIGNPASKDTVLHEIITGISEKTIIVAADEQSGSSATANRAIKQGREVIVTPHVNTKIEGATIVKNLGELKDTLGIAREGLKK